MSIISIVLLAASFIGICWCMYHIGWNDGFDCGWEAGRTVGVLEAAELCKDTEDSK